MMKRNIFLILFALFTISLSAQKAERKAIRSGNKAYDEQLYGNAEEEYQKALEVNAASKEASFNLANTYYKQEKWDEALKEYQHYLTLENENPSKMSGAWGNVGNTYLKKLDAQKQQPQGQPQQGGGQQQGPDNLQASLESYKNALRLNPNDEELRYNLAVVQKMIQDQQNQDQDQDNKDDKKDDKKEDKKDQQQDQQKQDQNQDKKDDKQDQQQENQMSQDNMEQMLKAIEQDEKETQERVKQMQAEERKRQNQHNKQHNKDW